MRVCGLLFQHWPFRSSYITLPTAVKWCLVTYDATLPSLQKKRERAGERPCFSQIDENYFHVQWRHFPNGTANGFVHCEGWARNNRFLLLQTKITLRSFSTGSLGCCEQMQTQFDWPTNGCLEHLADFSTAGSNVICARALLTNVHYTMTYSTLHWFRLFLQTARAFRAHLRLPSQLSDCNGNLIELQSTYAKKKRGEKNTLWVSFGAGKVL